MPRPWTAEAEVGLWRLGLAQVASRCLPSELEMAGFFLSSCFHPETTCCEHLFGCSQHKSENLFKRTLRAEGQSLQNLNVLKPHLRCVQIFLQGRH